MVLAIFPLAYYVTIGVVCVTLFQSSIGHQIQGAITFVLIHVLLVMVLWSYAKAIGTSPGYADEAPEEEGEKKTCKLCGAQKPIRAHHCSICNRCVLRMDHVCIFHFQSLFNFQFDSILIFLVALPLDQ
jgi:ribosomal protein L40E